MTDIRNRDNRLLQIPGKYETLDALTQAISEIVRYNLKETYFQDFASDLKALTTADVRKTTPKVISPPAMDGLSWVTVKPLKNP